MNERPERIHKHDFHTVSALAERRSRIVLLFTLVMMVVEILGGLTWNSMALLADGLHMGSHAFALGLSAAAYYASRKFASDKAFAFGTWKIEILAGYTSALLLLGVAVLMLIGSVERLFSPKPIDYAESITVASVGLFVNVVSIWLLGHFKGHSDHDGHSSCGHSHSDHRHSARDGFRQKSEPLHRHDLNLKAAYIHVLTDLLTSVLAIIALLGGAFWGLSWLDPVTGLVGAVLVAIWAKGLIMECGKILLDREMDHPIVSALHHLLEERSGSWNGVRLLDLHVWRIGKDRFSAALAVETRDSEIELNHLRKRLEEIPDLVHSTVEIHQTRKI